MITMDKIFKALNSINGFSKKLIFFGSTFVLGCCIIGITLIMYNHSFTNQVELYTIGSTLIQKSIVVYSQVVIAALIMDWFKNTFQNDD